MKHQRTVITDNMWLQWSLSTMQHPLQETYYIWMPLVLLSQLHFPVHPELCCRQSPFLVSPVSSAIPVAICTPYCFNILHLSTYVCFFGYFVGFFSRSFFFLYPRVLQMCLEYSCSWMSFSSWNVVLFKKIYQFYKHCANTFIQNHCVVLFCFVFSLWSGVCIWRQNLLWRTKRNCVFKLRGLCSVWVQGKNTLDGIKILAC